MRGSPSSRLRIRHLMLAALACAFLSSVARVPGLGTAFVADLLLVLVAWSLVRMSSRVEILRGRVHRRADEGARSPVAPPRVASDLAVVIYHAVVAIVIVAAVLFTALLLLIPILGSMLPGA